MIFLDWFSYFKNCTNFPQLIRLRISTNKKQTKKYRDKNSRTIGFFYFLRCGNLTNTLSSCELIYNLSSEWPIDYTLYILIYTLSHAGSVYNISPWHTQVSPGHRSGCSYATVVTLWHFVAMWPFVALWHFDGSENLRY